MHDSISNSIALMMKSNCQDEESHQDSDTLKDEDIPPPSGPEEEWLETDFTVPLHLTSV